MSMSQNTKFTLLNGKEEIKIEWDITNGEICFIREKIPQALNKNKKNNERNIFRLRVSDLTTNDWLDFAENINNSLEKLFSLYDFSESTIKKEDYKFYEEDDDDDD